MVDKGPVGAYRQENTTAKNVMTAAEATKNGFDNAGSGDDILPPDLTDVNNPDAGNSDDSSGSGTGWYGGYGGGSGSAAQEPAKKNWNKNDIGSNPDAMNQYLNPDAAKQNEYLQGLTPDTDALMQQANDALAAAGIGGRGFYEGAGITGDVNIDKIDHINFDEERALLEQLKQAQEQQAHLNATRTVEEGTTEYQRNLEDAQKQYQTQRDQIEAEEARAKDNQALYSEARGDRGGIGQAQYDAIQNNAAQAKYNVHQAQVQTAQDVQRAITSLRAQGKFQEAEQLLQITQNHLAQLMDLATKQKEMNLGIDEFNTQLDQWVENYKLDLLSNEINVENFRWNVFSNLQNAAMNNLNAQMNIAQATGAWADGSATYQARLNAINQLADSGNALLQAGIAPTSEQLAAMGLSQEQALAYLKKYFPYG